MAAGAASGGAGWSPPRSYSQIPRTASASTAHGHFAPRSATADSFSRTCRRGAPDPRTPGGRVLPPGCRVLPGAARDRAATCGELTYPERICVLRSNLYSYVEEPGVPATRL
ncbi:hypothetical protein Kpho02_73520 [Kitasatospora phosalacinea]|uniref:Uncharacterized protein n=1 Tax=Kitasatospora phosalacinea TaxID=2065 RepID=A0A9W6QEQ8_9ACTN|nr:hypothetical protein Kpho02_73520 [Kitasatospora phosalacinea]